MWIVFRSRLLSELKRLVAYDIGSFNVVSPAALAAQIGAVDPEDCRRDSDEEILGAYLSQNPLVAAADPHRVLKFSYFIALRQLHRLDLYDAAYRELQVERQIAFLLPAPATNMIGVALSRRRPDFSERDRLVLDTGRPLVVAAYERAITLTGLRGTMSALERAGDSTAQTVVVLDPDGRIQLATAAARGLLAALPSPHRPSCLPEPLASRSEAQRRRGGTGQPLVIGDATASFVCGAVNGFDAIVVERPATLSVGAMRAAGSTRREAEIMMLVAQGLTNTLIALELTVSERTVAKRLEHVFAKLGVSNRTAAVAWARAQRSVPPRDGRLTSLLDARQRRSQQKRSRADGIAAGVAQSVRAAES